MTDLKENCINSGQNEVSRRFMSGGNDLQNKQRMVAITVESRRLLRNRKREIENEENNYLTFNHLHAF